MTMARERVSYHFDTDFQDLILACMIKHPERFAAVGDIVLPEYFYGVQSMRVCKAMHAYFQKAGHFPVVEALGNFVFDLESRDDHEKARQAKAYVLKLGAMDTRDVDYVVESTVRFARERAVINAIHDAAAKIQDGKWPEEGFAPAFDRALRVGEDTEDVGYSLKDDADKVIDKVTAVTYGVATKYAALDALWFNGWGPGWLVVPLAPPKSFKCFGKGTGILMYDGTVKAVENVVVGDVVMGDDSTPRNVLTSGSGVGPLYRVSQSSGEDFVCNDAHLLCFKSVAGVVTERRTDECAGQTSWFYRENQCYKAAVDFPEQPVPLDPYLLGLWLGDGTSSASSVCVAHADVEIAEYLRAQAKLLGLRVAVGANRAGCCQMRFSGVRNTEKCCFAGCSEIKRGSSEYCGRHYGQMCHKGYRVAASGNKKGKNTVLGALKGLNVLSNKHIPNLYACNCRQTRLRVLAGLLDSDGYLSSGGSHKKRRFIFYNSNSVLAAGACRLARSLGFHVSMARYVASIKSTGYEGKCWHVTITGDISKIPTLLPRKRGVDSFKRKNGRYKIKVASLGVGYYHGFTVDGNHRFLLSDFTVTHNSTICVNLALNMVNGKGSTPAIPVFYYACELSAELTLMRAYSRLTGIKMEDFYKERKGHSRLATHRALEDKVEEKLVVKYFPAKTATIKMIRAHTKTAIDRFGVRPKAIFIDHAETIRPGQAGKNVSDWRQQADIYTEARALGDEFKCVVIMPDRCNREACERSTPSMTGFQGALEKAGIVDVGIGICQSPDERKPDPMDEQGRQSVRYFVFLNRHGRQYVHLGGHVNPETMEMTVEKEIPWTEADGGKKHVGNGGGAPAAAGRGVLLNEDAVKSPTAGDNRAPVRPAPSPRKIH